MEDVTGSLTDLDASSPYATSNLPELSGLWNNKERDNNLYTEPPVNSWTGWHVNGSLIGVLQSSQT